ISWLACALSCQSTDASSPLMISRGSSSTIEEKIAEISGLTPRINTLNAKNHPYIAHGLFFHLAQLKWNVIVKTVHIRCRFTAARGIRFRLGILITIRAG